MKKLYLFIFLIVIGGVTQIQLVNARTNKLFNGKTTLAPANQTITFPAIASPQNLGTGDITLSATASSALAVSYGVNNTNVATIVAGKLHIVGGGTVVVTASQAGDGVNWNAAANVSQTIVVNAAAQTITFTQPVAAVFGAADVTLTATASSALPVTFTSSNPAVATIVAGKLHVVSASAATVDVTATQPGDGINFAAATAVTRTVTITKGGTAVLTGLTATTTPLVSTDLTLAVTSTFNPLIYLNNPIVYTSSNPAVATIVNGKVHLVATGTTTITASQPGTTNFVDAVPLTAVYTVTAPAAPVFTTNLAGKVVGGLDVDPAATVGAYFATIVYTSNNPLAATIVNNKLHFNAPAAAGTVTITATQTYPIGTGGTGTVTATNTTLSITAATASTAAAPAITLTAPGNRVFGDVDITLTATSSYSLPVPITYTTSNPALATIVNGNLHLVGIGTGVTVTASQGGGAGSATTPADVTSAAFNITAPTLTMAAIAKVSNAADFAPPVVASLTNTPVVYTVTAGTNVAVIQNGIVHLTGVAGTATIKASQQGNTTTTVAPAVGLLPADVTATLTVTTATTANAPVISFGTLGGTRQYTTSDVSLVTAAATGAVVVTSTLANPPITYTTSNPAIAYVTSNSISGITQTAQGTGYTAGTYYNVPLTGGTGTGAQATIIVTPGGQALATITNQGRGYNVNDVLTFAPQSLNNTANGSGYIATVSATANNTVHFVGSPPAPNNTVTLTATQGGGATGTLLLPADVPQALTVTPLTINFPTLGTKTYSAQDFNPGAGAASTSTRIVYLTSSNPAVATITATQAYTLTSGGTLYTNGVYTNVPLYGGTGTGMTATITIASGSITATGTTITNIGTNYSTGDVLTVPSSLIGGTGSGLVITLGGYTGVIHYNPTVPAAPNNTSVITASMGGGVNGTTTLAPDVSQVLTLVNPAINFPALGTKQFTSVDLNPGASGALIGLPVTYTSSNPAVATIVNGFIHFTGAPAAPNNTTVITASQAPLPGVNIGTASIPASVSQTLTVTPATITFPALNTRTLGADFLPGASSTVTNTPIVYTSSNTAVATINVGGISTSTVTNGTLYNKAGTYVNVPLTGGTGTGATALVIVLPQGIATGIISNSGIGYSVGDVLTITPASVGGTTGSGFTVTVTAVNSMVHMVAAGNANITASQGGGAAGTLTLPADVIQPLTVTAPVINFPILGTRQLSSTDFAPGATSSLSGVPITYSSSNTAIATIVTGAIVNTTTLTGSGYTDGTYTANLNGGTGTGAAVTVTFLTGSSPVISLAGNPSGYSVGDVLTPVTGGLGTTGSGFTLTVTSTGSAVRFVSSPASPNNTVTITASQGGGATGTASLPADATQVLTVTPPSINFAALNTKAYPQVDFLLTATSTLNKTITYTSSNTAVATIVVVTANPGAGTYLHLVGAGTSNITASQGGGAAGITTLPADVVQALNVTQIIPKLNFPALGTRVLTNVDIVTGVTSSLAGIPITYSSDNTSVATIVNGKVHMVAAGTANIKASQGSAAGTLTIPADVIQPITITAPTLTFPALGTKPYSPVDFNPGATSSITNIPVTYTSSNPAVATVATTLLLGTPIGGSGYKDGTYTNVPLTGGTGTGALATVVVFQGSVSTVTPTNIGKLYTPGDVLSCQALSIGGVGNGFNVTVASYYTLVHMIPNVPASPNNTTTITASLGGGVAGTASLPADISQVLTVVTPTITFPALGTVAYTPVDFNPNATTTITSPTITYTSSNPAVATINNTLSLGTLTGGSGYVNGTYTNVNLTGGAGAGAQGTVTVAGGVVTSVKVTAPGKLYVTGDALTAPAASIGGGTGTGFKVLVANFSSMVHLVLPVPASPNNTSTITATVSGGAATAYPLPADATSLLTVTAPTYTFPALGSKVYTTTDFDPGATSTAPGLITYTSSDTTAVKIVAGRIHLVKTFTTPSVTITATQNGIAFATSAITAVTSPTLTFTALGSTPFRTVDVLPTATSTNGLVGIVYTSSDTNTVSIVKNALHIKKLGTVTIRATQQNTPATAANAAANGILPADATSSFTITAPVITFAAIGSKAYNITDLQLTATSTLISLPITYTSSDPNVATIVNGNLHYVGLGTTTITASQTAAAIAAGLPVPAEQAQVVTVTVPTLTFPAVGTPKPWNSADLAIATTTGTVSTLGNLSPVVITSSDPSVATIVYNTGVPAIHYVGIGTTTLTASQAGYGNIPGPAPIQQVLTVTPATLTVAAAGAKTTLSADASPTLTVTLAVTSVPVTYTTSDPTVATFVGGVVHVVGVGSAVLTASQITNANYAPLPSVQTVTVTAAVATTPLLSFTTPLGTRQYTNGADIVPAVTNTSTAAPVLFTSSNPLVATIVNNNIHLTPPAIINGVAVYPNPATTTITASQGGGPNGVPGVLPADASQVLTVTPASITFPPLGVQRLSTVDLNPGATSSYTLLASDNTALPITYTSSDPTVATIVNNQIHFVGNGSTVITASLGNVIVPDVSQTMVVSGSAITFPATSSRVFSTTDALPGATSTATNLISYTSSDPTVLTIVANSIAALTVGAPGTGYTPGVYSNIPLTGGSGTGALANITVASNGQATAFLTTQGKDYKVGDVLSFTPASLGTTPVSGGSGFNTTINSLGGGMLHFTGIGTATVTATQTAGVPASTISASQVVTVTAPTLTFTGTRSQAFSLTDLDPGATSTISGVPITYTSSNPALVSIVNNKLHFNVLPANGGYSNVATITATQAAVGNYPAPTAQQVLTVNQSIIVQNPLTKYYGDPDFSPGVSSLGYTVAYTSATPATATVVNGGTLVHILAPGSTILTASQAGDASTIAAANAACTLTVAPAPLIVSPKSITRLYGVENPVQYPLIYTGFKSSTGGVPLDDSTKFTTQPVLLSVTSAANPTVNILPLNGGFIPKTLPVGVYTLTYGGGASTFYSLLYGTGTLTVTPAPQTLTMDQTTINKKVGDADFDPLARSTGDPVVLTSSNTAVATISSTGKVQIVGVGTATITASISPTSGNYSGSASLSVTLNVGLGTQTINPIVSYPSGQQTISSGSLPFLVKGNTLAVTATASSALPVQFVVGDPSIASVNGNVVKGLRIGKTVVTLKQPGNASYSAAPDVILFLEVVDASGDQVSVHLALSPNGDGINDFLIIEGVQDYPGNHVSIINRNGIKVFSTSNYDNKKNVFTGKSDSGEQLPAGTYFYLVDYNVGETKNHITGYFVLKY